MASSIQNNRQISMMHAFCSREYFFVSIFDLRLKQEINRKLRVATEIGSTFFWFLTSYRAAEKCKMIIYHQHEISDR
jgi:hypothetical protein